MMLQIADPQPKQWTREDYYQLAEAGYFEGHDVQLIDGEIIQMPPQKHPHSFAVSIVAKFLRSCFADGYWVREEKPLHLGELNEPEPDVAVVLGNERDFQDHPTTALLVVEVSQSSLALDQKKAAIYAAASIEEYWIIDLKNRQVHTMRMPNKLECRYENTAVLHQDAFLSPIRCPSAKLKVSELF